MITSKQFQMLMEVVKAAKEGRYMYGNGAQWYIVDECGQKLYINHITGEKQFIPNYEGTPRVDMQFAESMERWLANEEAERAEESNLRYSDAKAWVAKAVKEGRLLFTNGNQWYIQNAEWSGYVTIVELGTLAAEARLYHMNLHASWKYMRFNGNTRPTVTMSTKQYLGIQA